MHPYSGPCAVVSVIARADCELVGAWKPRAAPQSWDPPSPFPSGKTKIADFGLTRDVQSGSVYRGNNREALPMRWAAEEVIRNYTYGRGTE